MGMQAEARRQAAAKETRKRRQRLHKPTISIVGVGRLGTALALALAARKYSIEAVVAHRKQHTTRAARLLDNADILTLSSAQLDQLPSSDILFITTPDDRIVEVAAEIARSQSPDGKRRRIALHASGALSSHALNSLREVGFDTGSLHPLLSVSDPARGALALSKAFFCIEGDLHAVKVARAMVRDLGASSFTVSAQHKALYHAAAVMASGHMVALFDITTEMLTRCGLNEKRARAVLLPLVESTIENLRRGEPPVRALTGTFARADALTVQKHLEALASLDSTAALAAYILLGERSLQLAREKGADAASLEEISRTLKKVKK